jgi:CheY-like chemotaxis protein
MEFAPESFVQSSERQAMNVVLVVEDDPDLRAVLESVLARLGCEIRAASSASEGLANLLCGDVDIVITDWMLGDDVAGAMLEKAGAAGVLDGVHVIVHSSSAPAIRAVPGAVIVPKSAGMSVLLSTVAQLQRTPGRVQLFGAAELI